MKLVDALIVLKPIAKSYGLNLSKSNDFKIARLLLVNLYCHDFQYE